MSVTLHDQALAVTNGAALLDERVPDWVSRIDTEALSQRSMKRCVLGQLYGDFAIGMNALFGEVALKVALEHGFDYLERDEEYECAEDPWRDLDDLWLAEIEARRG